MKTRRLLFAFAMCAGLALFSAGALAQVKDEKKAEPAKPAAAQPAPAKPAEKPAGGKPEVKPGAPAGGAEMESMMKMMQEAAAPGKEHEALKPLIGSFTCANKFYAGPGAPPAESTGTVERKWIFGNRYVQEDVKGNMFGMPFEGFGITGYDKPQKMYHAFWIDNMGTGYWMMTGTADAAGKVFTFTGENFDPMVNAKKKGKTTMDLTDPNKHTMKMLEPGPDGKDLVTFDMTCTRK